MNYAFLLIFDDIYPYFLSGPFYKNMKQTKIIWKYLAGCAMTRYILGHRLLETSL